MFPYSQLFWMYKPHSFLTYTVNNLTENLDNLGASGVVSANMLTILVMLHGLGDSLSYVDLVIIKKIFPKLT